MNGWHGKSVLSSDGWSTEDLVQIFELAAHYKKCIENKKDISTKTGLSCLTLFYEPSTRTRLSFESAALRLGINYLSVANAGHDSSAFKGETLEDTGRILSAYGDVIIMRHPELGSSKRLSSKASVPVINAGDGAGEHPTQALLDLFTLQEAFGRIHGLRLGFCGDLKNSRTVHSLLNILKGYDCEIVAISPQELELAKPVASDMASGTASFRTAHDLRPELGQLDMLYMTRVQKERFDDPQLYNRMKNEYTLTATQLSLAPAHLKVFHPLPRVDEMDRQIDDDKRAHYFIQAANGVPVRMALLSSMLGITR